MIKSLTKNLKEIFESLPEDMQKRVNNWERDTTWDLDWFDPGEQKSEVVIKKLRDYQTLYLNREEILTWKRKADTLDSIHDALIFFKKGLS